MASSRTILLDARRPFALFSPITFQSNDYEFPAAPIRLLDEDGANWSHDFIEFPDFQLRIQPDRMHNDASN